MTKMYQSNIYFAAIILVLLAIVKTETPISACEQKEKKQALLDLAKESINKAKDLQPNCDVHNKNIFSNSTECGPKEKVSAYLDIAKNLIDEAKSNDSTCDVTKDITDNVTNNITEIVTVERHKRPADCLEVLENGHLESNEYWIWPRNRIFDGRSVKVYCDMKTLGGGWTVIQRRINSSFNRTDFYRDWKSYKHGFGDIWDEFWLGNDIIFALTNQRNCSLLFLMVNWSLEGELAIYTPFWIEDENAGYVMHIGDYNGTAGDGIRDSDNTKFSTKDKRNYVANHACIEEKKGGWWYKDCSSSNPNGELKPGATNDKKLANWYPWTNYDSLYWMEMMIR